MKLHTARSLVFITACLAGAVLPQYGSAQTAEVTTRTSPVQVGEMAPDFTLEDQQGRKVMLSSAHGKMPTVLVFYRGYW